jgi:hypothetical protein
MRPILKQAGDPAHSPFEQLADSCELYCSFCEAPLGSVDDIAWKVSPSAGQRQYDIAGARFTWYAGLPPIAGAWVNLLLACASCRAARGEFPGVEEGLQVLLRDDLAQFAGIVAAIHGAGLSAAQIQTLAGAAASVMVWPDTSLDGDGNVLSLGASTASLFTHEYTRQSQLDLVRRGLVRLTDEQQQQAWAAAPVDGLWVVPDATHVGGLPNPARALEQLRITILALNLNFTEGPFGGADQRVRRRTDAYNAARHLWDLLTQVALTIVGAGSPAQIVEDRRLQLLYTQIRQSVRATGFWSAWSHSLLQSLAQAPWTGFPAETRRALAYDLLIQCDPTPLFGPPDDAPEPVMVLSGTDVDRIPWC